MTLVDWGPAAQMAAIGGSLAAGLAATMAWRQRRRGQRDLLRSLTWLLLFLTFDLIVFGAFTRLSDSGLGCPDWPGCYGKASPLGARHDIATAEAALPTGPVTSAKAWIEMIHRYLATAVGALILAMLVGHLRRARQALPAMGTTGSGAWPGWTALIFVWVCAQGAFGALTVTMKLYPAIVTLHLLGGVGLLGLIAVLARRQTPGARALPGPLRAAARAGLVLLLLQVALGGWVSTNYAVLACQDFPTCQGRWWPPMDLATGFEWQRELGQTGDGAFLPFAALTAIHVVHRLGALVVLLALGGLAVWLHRQGRARAAAALAGLLAWQVASGVSNVVLDWPLAAALAHTAGAAALVALLSALSTLRAVMPPDSRAGMLGRR